MRRCICLYASELGAAVNENPYKHPCDVALALWKRFDPVHFAKAKARQAQKRRIPEKHVGSAHAVVESVVHEVPKLNAIVEKCCAKVKNGSLDNMLMLAEKEIKQVLEQDEACSEKTVSIGLKNEDILSFVQDAISSAYGRDREQKTMKDMAEQNNPVSDNNTKFYCKEIGQVCEGTGLPVYVYKIGGRIDGTVNSGDKGKRLIEIKNRKNRFMTPVPAYDVLQMQCYMFLLGKTECDLIERLNDGRSKTTTIPFDQTLWTKTLVQVRQFMRLFVAIYETEEWQDRLLSKATMSGQREVYSRLAVAFANFETKELNSSITI